MSAVPSAAQRRFAALRRTAAAYVLAAVAVAGASTAARVQAQGAAPAATTTPPNIVVILADDLGYGDLASYGHPEHRTPNLDAMARDGVRATAAYAPSPSCSPTRASVLTGKYAFRVGIRSPLSPRSASGLAAKEHVTLPQVLKARGYATMAVGKWHLGDQRGMRPLDHAFDRFGGLLYSHDYKDPWVKTEERLSLWDGEARREDDPDAATLTATYTAEAVGFIRENAAARRPFFLYVAHSMPHVPLAVSPPFKGRTSTLYGDVIAELDDSVGQVRAALETAGVERNTIVIFTSDNGPWNAMPERMFGRDIVKRWDHGTPGPFRGGKAGTYEGGHRVPFVAVWPGNLTPGHVLHMPISLVDLFPTLAARAGATDAIPGDVDGVDLWPTALSNGGTAKERAILYDNLGQAEAIRVGPWKLRVAPAAGGPGTPELFHLLNDPSERYDVAAAHPDVVERLRRRLGQENARR